MSAPIFSLLYVSRSMILPPGDAVQLAQIVDHAVAFNAANGITGALIATDHYFTQYLEGAEPVVAALMDRIRADIRHSDVRVLRSAAASARLFGRWSLAYSGSTRFLDREIEPALIASLQADEYSGRLLALMREFVRYDGIKAG